MANVGNRWAVQKTKDLVCCVVWWGDRFTSCTVTSDKILLMFPCWLTLGGVWSKYAMQTHYPMGICINHIFCLAFSLHISLSTVEFIKQVVKKDIFKEKSQRKCLLIKDNDASNVVNELRGMACAVTHIIRFACLCALLISLTYLTTYRKQPTNDHANSPRTSAMHFKLRLFNWAGARKHENIYPQHSYNGFWSRSLCIHTECTCSHPML